MAERAGLWCWYDGSRFQITRQLPDETVPLTMGTAANEDALESFGLQSEFSADNFVINAFDPVARSLYTVMGREVPFSGEFHPWARQAESGWLASTPKQFSAGSRLSGDNLAPMNQAFGNSDVESVMYFPPKTPSRSIYMGKGPAWTQDGSPGR